MDKILVFAVLGLALVMFVTGRWRYDLVALVALLILVVADIIPFSEAYSGFSHPAVVTVAAVLVGSRTLHNSGAVDIIAKWMAQVGTRLVVQLASVTGLISLLSAFMNNVGALALLMPVAIRMARRGGHPSSTFLMPLAFASLLGGMITLIGTPPNIIIATFRETSGGEPFRMFDFAPVGLAVTVVGVAFVSLVGWRLIPKRQAQSSLGDSFHIEDYMTELGVPAESRFVGKLLRTIEEVGKEDVRIVGLIRKGRRYEAPSSYEFVDANDVFIVEADPDDLKTFIDDTGFKLEGTRDLRADVEESMHSEEASIIEVVVAPGGLIEGRTALGMHLHARHGVNLLGVSRRGKQLTRRLGRTILQAGDVLLLQGKTAEVQAALPVLGLLPLAERDLRVGQRRRVLVPTGVFVGALALAAFDILPVQISFMGAVVILLMTRFLTLRAAYQAIDWPVIVLLGAMIPVGQALETTGGAELIASTITDFGSDLPAWMVLGVILIATMFLSDLVNNAAAVIIMAPIGIGVAQSLGASADPFLMAVAIGGSSAFLTPIGHQSNTIVMGPGGYHFSDYWRMGLPLEAIIVAVSLPIILIIWPLGI